MVDPADRSGAGDVVDVVTAFVWDGQRVLLALRSERVSTFPGHWAGISGYVEHESPLERAWIEVEEETGLPRRCLTLRRLGQPLEVRDEHYSRTFRVHPVLLALDEPRTVQPDWEAARLRWVEVEQLARGALEPAVPRLYDAWARVWPAWSPAESLDANLDAALASLRDDRSHGAGALARQAAWELAKLVRLAADAGFDAHRGWLASAISALARARPAMAAPANLLEPLAAALGTASDADELVHTIGERVAACDAAEQAAAANAAWIISEGATVLTISDSGTVRATLLAAAARLARVYVCEGRPLCEGRRLAERLAAVHIPVTLVTDAAAGRVVEDVDFVLLGADRIEPDGTVVNKMGSGLVALAAHAANKPVMVVAASLKFRRAASALQPLSPPTGSDAASGRESRDERLEELNSPDEIWPDRPPGVDVLNPYFEPIDPEWITSLVTELGPQGPRDPLPRDA